jgi:hypothetical protein
MFNKKIVQEALNRTWILDNNPGLTPEAPTGGQDTVVSFLIYDIFGGEILKTHKKKGWHFYNRINGERIDFTCLETNRSAEDSQFEDLPSTPDETHIYFEQVDYSTFFTRFIRAFEETVGLEEHQPTYSS